MVGLALALGACKSPAVGDTSAPVELTMCVGQGKGLDIEGEPTWWATVELDALGREVSRIDWKGPARVVQRQSVHSVFVGNNLVERRDNFEDCSVVDTWSYNDKNLPVETTRRAEGGCVATSELVSQSRYKYDVRGELFEERSDRNGDGQFTQVVRYLFEGGRVMLRQTFGRGVVGSLKEARYFYSGTNSADHEERIDWPVDGVVDQIIARTYDENGYLSSEVYEDASSQVVASYTFANRLDGQVEFSIADDFLGYTLHTRTYDTSGRLIGGVFDRDFDGDGEVDFVDEYTYEWTCD